MTPEEKNAMELVRDELFVIAELAGDHPLCDAGLVSLGSTGEFFREIVKVGGDAAIISEIAVRANTALTVARELVEE